MPRLRGIINAFAIIILVALALLAGSLFIGPAGSGLLWPDDYTALGIAFLVLVAVIIATRPKKAVQPAEAKKENIGIRIAKAVILALGIILFLFFIGLITHQG